MADPSRLYAGFSSLIGGMNAGLVPDLIGVTQAAMASNVTFRNGIPSTRPPWWGRVLSVPSSLSSRWVGKFQGATFYQADEGGQSLFVVSRGGNLFTITPDTWAVNEITPKLNIATTQDFIVPAPAGTVSVSLNSETPLSVGETVIIDSGHYTVASLFTDGAVLTYVSGAANATVKAGALVFDSTSTQISEYQSNSADANMVFLFQAENYVIVLAGPYPTIIYDGFFARRVNENADELPPGFIGAYGWGRIWIAQTNRRTFIAGDIVYGSSGTAEKGFRDAILKVTENDFLNEGGAFAVPFNSGPITAMQFLATQDTSLGVGVLLVGTTNMVFSVNAPVDRTTWKNLQYPIQTVSLLDYGPESPRGTVSINGDMDYRSKDGARSFQVSRRNFPDPGNVPWSHEVDPIFNSDTDSLLLYGSGVYFNKKWLQTVSPFLTTMGVAHRGLVVMNFDPLSNLSGQAPPIWEGVSSGLNVCQVLKGTINGSERAFAFAQGADIELWEIIEDGTPDGIDDQIVSPAIITRKPISAFLESRAEDYGQATALKQLYMGEIYLDDIAEDVTITIKFRPDQYPLWLTWQTIELCATTQQCTFPPNCGVFQPNSRLYASRLTIGQPPDSCNGLTGSGILTEGRLFQFRLEWQGHLRWRKFITHAKIVTQPMEGSCPSEVECVLFPFCDLPIYGYDSHSS